MNKRIKKKHKWLGAKRAGANYCANEISRHIGRKILYSGITPKPSYILNVRRHVRWLFHHSSEEEWIKRVAEAYCPAIKDMLDDMAEKRKARKEKLLSGENVNMDDPQSMAYRIRAYEEYGASGKLLSQEKEENACSEV